MAKDAYYRPDIWTDEDDLILAETVHKSIREGVMLKIAFFVSGERLGRTQNACKQRWNSYLKHRYTASIELAKAHAKRRKVKEMA